ncbi:MAG: GntR family transcriptional regulator [Hyphomicrobiales bacterium]|nr:GntR family transcriptional regulator [Hyphomicrobiales bacterium]
MSSLSPLARRSLHDELRQRLRDMIINGDLAPSTKVPERQLCETFGVSRTPLREALKVLAAENLVILAPNRGAVVAPIVLEELEEILPVMAALESLSGLLATRMMNNEQIAEVRGLHNELRLRYEEGDQKAYFATNRRIHDKIRNGAANELLTLHYNQVSYRIRRARLVTGVSQKLWDQSMIEHEEIITRLEARDEASLPVLLKQHILSMLHHYQSLPRIMAGA